MRRCLFAVASIAMLLAAASQAMADCSPGCGGCGACGTAAVEGSALTEQVVVESAAAAKADVDPMSDHRASAAYRIAMTEVLVKRCLTRCIQRLDRGGAE